MASSDNRVAFGTFVDKPTETFVGNLGSRFVLSRMLACVKLYCNLYHTLPNVHSAVHK